MSAQASQTASGTSPNIPMAGRRRAQLIERGGKAAVEQRLSLDDVKALQGDSSPASRAAVAAKFGQQYDSLIEGDTRPLAEAILELLVRDVERKVRQTLSEVIAASPNLPHGITARLARDDVEVACPILEQSPVLADEDLAEIVRTHTMQYALAVAGRERLSEWLCDVVAETGVPEVIVRLVGNGGAQLSGTTLKRIADDYRDDRAIQERLIQRPALPYELVDLLVTAISERLQWELVRERRMTRAAAQELMAAARERATLSIVVREHGERSIEREVRERLSSGELGPEDVLAFLRDGEVARVEASLALLADVDLRRARQLLYGADKRGLAALCTRAGFGSPHYVALRMALDLAEQGVKGSAPEVSYPPETAQFVQDQYERIKGDEAQVAMWFD